MLNALFNERRRADLRKAIADGSPIVFNRKKPSVEVAEPDGQVSSQYPMRRGPRTFDVNPAETEYEYRL